MRNPATPRSHQKRTMSSNSRRTSSFHQLRSGCCGLEVVQVVLAAGLVEVPGRPAEDAGPVVGQAAVRLGVGPDVVVPVCRVPPAQRVDEPGVLVAGVVGHQVHEDADATRAGLAHEVVEVVEGAERGIDVAVVRHVVAPVAVGRAGDRRQPDAADAEPRQVVELGDDAGQVAHAVPVRVGVGAGVDLVEDAAVPPAVGVTLGLAGAMGIPSARRVARERIDSAVPSHQDPGRARPAAALPGGEPGSRSRLTGPGAGPSRISGRPRRPPCQRPGKPAIVSTRNPRVLTVPRRPVPNESATPR